MTSVLQYQEQGSARFLFLTGPILSAEFPAITTASVFSIIKIRFTSIEALGLSWDWHQETHPQIFFMTNVLQYQGSDIDPFLLPTEPIPTADFPAVPTAGVFTGIITD
jgi:hypothetical protein